MRPLSLVTVAVVSAVVGAVLFAAATSRPSEDGCCKDLGELARDLVAGDSAAVARALDVLGLTERMPGLIRRIRG